ncbi:MAG: CHAD domain-containing protein [Polyangiaceae bacterium]|jgi:CHAD domain-containing protein
MTRGPALASTSATVGPFLVDALRALDGRLAQAGRRVLAADDDRDAVHDLRVALRRARTALEVGRPVLGVFHADEVRRALRDVQRATGALRDEEVLLDLVGSLGMDRPEVLAWIEGRRRRERALRSALRRMVRAGGLDRGRRLLDALLAFRVRPSRDRRLTKFARRAVDDARRGVERRRTARIEDAEGMHRLRIAHKRLRYTVEAFASSLPPDLSALAQPAARLQSRLGELHDVDVAIACVGRARSLQGPAREALLAALARLRAERARACEQELGAPPGSVFWMRHPVGRDSLRKISTR